MSRKAESHSEPVANPERAADLHPESFRTVDAETYDGEREDDEPPHESSLTEVAAEALRTGVVGDGLSASAEVPGEDRVLQAGDPDLDPLETELSGDEVPGGDTPTPNQNNVDDIGALYGVSDMNSGALKSTEELLERRDAHRWDAESLSPKA